MACNENERRCFTFVWKLENISYCLQKELRPIKSPSFVVDAIECTKWKLWLYPRGVRVVNSVGYFLYRETDCKGTDKIEIKFELAFIGKNGSVLLSKGVMKRTFSKGARLGYPTFINRNDVFMSRRSEFLPHDTLMVRCRIWKSAGEMTENVRCTAFTRFGVEKRSIEWNIKNFNTLESEKKNYYQIKSLQNEMPLMSIDLSMTEGTDEEEIIRFGLSLQDHTIKFFTLRLFLLDVTGNRVECNQEEMWFDDPTECKQITFPFTKKKLIEEKRVYLFNDTWPLLWEWAFSKGVVSEEIEEVLYGCACSESKVTGICKIDDDNMSLSNALIDNMKSLYDEHFLSDVKLKTTTSTFLAHKFTLSASSPVFKAMFSNDMKEKSNDCVNIEDLSDDTIHRMLLFVYTTRIGDLTFDRASNLYVAADKYAILSLKNICSSFMKKNLSPSNACEMLLLSDFHADSDLKSAVQDYILKNGKRIINSDEWNVLIETNSKLAAETLSILYK